MPTLNIEVLVDKIDQNTRPPNPPSIDEGDEIVRRWQPKCHFCGGTDDQLGSGLISLCPNYRVLAHRDCYLHKYVYLKVSQAINRMTPLALFMAFVAGFTSLSGSISFGLFILTVTAIAPVILITTWVYLWKYIPPEKL